MDIYVFPRHNLGREAQISSRIRVLCHEEKPDRFFCFIQHIHLNFWESYVICPRSQLNKGKSDLPMSCVLCDMVTFRKFDTQKVVRGRQGRCSLLNHTAPASEKSDLTPPIHFRLTPDIYLLLEKFHNYFLTQRSANFLYRASSLCSN